MGKSTSLSVEATGRGIVSQAGAITLVPTAEQVGLIGALSAGLRPWRKPLASHNPGTILTTWRSRWLSVGTVWPIWRCCADSPQHLGRWPPIRPCRG